MATQYYMRAFNTTLSQYVDWVVNDTPDSTGTFSGYPTNQLINITVNRVAQSKVANFLKQNQSLGGVDGYYLHVNSYDWRNAVSPIGLPTNPTGLAVERGITSVASISAATNASPIAITSSTSHSLATGQLVTINGVTGNVAANGSWPIIVTGATTFTLTGSTGSGSYISGGSIFVPTTFSTLTWDETNSTWRFVANTNGDGTTLGSSQSLRVNNFSVDGFIGVGPAPLPTHGLIRLPNNQYIFGENAQGTGDIQLLGSDPLNRIKLGALTTDIVYLPGILDVDGYVQHDGNGTNTPVVGFIREQNNTSIVAVRNSTPSFSDIVVLSSNNVNQVVLGDNVNSSIVHNTASASFSITAATAASPVQITVSSPTNFVTGQSVNISGITGTIGTDATNGLNGKFFSIAVVDTTHFTLTGTNGAGLVYTSGGTTTTNNVHQFQVGSNPQLEVGTGFVRFPSAVSAPLLYQVTAASSTSGQNLTVQSQNAGLGGSNGGNLTLTTGTGATNGNINLQTGGVTRVNLNDTTETHTHQTITFANTVANPIITQNSTSSASGTPLTVSAQASTLASSTGGNLLLNSGAGTSNPGNVDIQTGGTNQIIVSPTFIAPGTSTGQKTAGSVIILGSLEVVGTTTTVDSTVVDIIGRVIHANWSDPSASPNVALPSQNVGYSVHRGNVTGQARDGAAWIWTEGNQNSGADGYWRAVTIFGDGYGTDNFNISNSPNIVGVMANDFSSSSDPNPVPGYLASTGGLRTANNVPAVVSRNISTTTTISAASNLATLQQSTINVASTTGFTSAGTILVLSSAGQQVITYTGTSGGNQFTGCVGGTGTIITGGNVAQTNNSTTIASASNGVVLPQGTLNVTSTVGFPAAGTLRVFTSTSVGGVQIIIYTGTTGTTFTGCSGGSGTLNTGNSVSSLPIAGGLDLVLLGTDFGNHILYGAPSNNTGHIFNTPTSFVYDFQVNSVSQVQLTANADASDTTTQTIVIEPTVSAPKIYQIVQPNTGANNGSNLKVAAQTGQQQTGGNNNNNGGNIVLASGLAGTGGSGTVGVNGSVDLLTGSTLKMRVFPTTAATLANNNSIIYFENLFRVDTAQLSPLFRQDDNTTNAATGQNYTVQAQNAMGTTATGGDIVLTSGTGTTIAGNARLQTGGVDRVITHPSFTEFRDGYEALRITPVSSGNTLITFASTDTAATVNQTATAGASGATFTVQAQNALTTGGNAVVTSGTGVTAGNVNLQTGGVTKVSVNPTFTSFSDGYGEALRITPVSPGNTQITFASTDTAASINQTVTASATGAIMTVQSQNAATTGGALNLSSGTGGTTNGTVNLQAGTVTTASVVTNKFVLNKGWRRNLTNVTGTYQVLATDDYIAITAISAPFIITLPATPTLGDTYTVKDSVGNAATNNVTISGNGINIDGASTITLSQNYSAVVLTYTGSVWSIT